MSQEMSFKLSDDLADSIFLDSVGSFKNVEVICTFSFQVIDESFDHEFGTKHQLGYEILESSLILISENKILKTISDEEQIKLLGINNYDLVTKEIEEYMKHIELGEV